MKVCEYCSEPIAPGQRYYSKPKLVHAVCRRADDLNTETIVLHARLHVMSEQLRAAQRALASFAKAASAHGVRMASKDDLWVSLGVPSSAWIVALTTSSDVS
jgi:alpha-D-ribose 1-methylphosphonate 5-triphosphate diphosphatase PhnM